MMTQQQWDHVENFRMDRNVSYPKAVYEYCQNAIVVYDRFHIVKNLNESVDKTCREETVKAIK